VPETLEENRGEEGGAGPEAEAKAEVEAGADPELYVELDTEHEPI
jgi:hypothetical protein